MYCRHHLYKDFFIKNRTRTVVTLLLLWFEFLWISLYLRTWVDVLIQLHVLKWHFVRLNPCHFTIWRMMIRDFVSKWPLLSSSHSKMANHILAGEEVQKLIAPCALLNAHRAISAIILKNELVLHSSYLVWMQSEDAHGLFRFVR